MTCFWVALADLSLFKQSAFTHLSCDCDGLSSVKRTLLKPRAASACETPNDRDGCGLGSYQISGVRLHSMFKSKRHKMSPTHSRWRLAHLAAPYSHGERTKPHLTNSASIQAFL